MFTANLPITPKRQKLVSFGVIWCCFIQECQRAFLTQKSPIVQQLNASAIMSGYEKIKV